MTLKPLVIVFAMVAAAPACAGWFDVAKGNDTGGIIPWADPPPAYRDIAMRHCANYNKVGVVTSVPHQYGDYAGFICTFPQGYDPVKAWYGPAVVSTRG